MDIAESAALATRLPRSLPPLAVDIDGTLTNDRRELDPRVMPICRAWPAPLVIATGKSMPYPVALTEFLGIERLVIAENGGVVIVGPTDRIRFEGDRESAQAVIDAYESEGYDLGWGPTALVNRWRETERVVSRDSPLPPLVEIADEHGLEVVDTGYAYHVKSPGVTKGAGLLTLADELGIDASSFVAIGDSENDASAFEVAGTGIAVGNADETARATAAVLMDSQFASGFLEAVEWVVEREEELG